MDPAYVKCFVQSIQNVFATMLQLPVSVREPQAKVQGSPPHDVSGIIGISGDFEGSIVLALPYSTAQNIVALFAGQRFPVDAPDFADAVGELINMISGNAKSLFKDRKCTISCPSVVVGGNHFVGVPSDTLTIVLPCHTDSGDFDLEVSMKKRLRSLSTPAVTAVTAASAKA